MDYEGQKRWKFSFGLRNSWWGAVPTAKESYSGKWGFSVEIVGWKVGKGGVDQKGRNLTVEEVRAGGIACDKPELPCKFR